MKITTSKQGYQVLYAITVLYILLNPHNQHEKDYHQHLTNNKTQVQTG